MSCPSAPLTEPRPEQLQWRRQFPSPGPGVSEMLTTGLLPYSDGRISNLSLLVVSQYKRLGFFVCDVYSAVIISFG